MKVAFFGTPAFAVPSLEELLTSLQHQVTLVVSRPDKKAGRKRVLTPPPVISLARNHGIDTQQPKTLKNFYELLEGAQVDAAVVVAYGRLIPDQLLTLPRYGFINLHPSLLPRHRGPSPIQWTLVCGDTTTGVTTMQLDSGMDTGPLLLQQQVDVNQDETTADLSLRLSQLGASLLVKTLNHLQAGAIEPQAQDEALATLTPMIKREFGELDWTMDGQQLINRHRGFTPWPGSYTLFQGRRLKILQLELVTNQSAQEDPGTIITTSETGIDVCCGDGSILRLTELQFEGRRSMQAAEFIRGAQVHPSGRLG